MGYGRPITPAADESSDLWTDIDPSQSFDGERRVQRHLTAEPCITPFDQPCQMSLYTHAMRDENPNYYWIGFQFGVGFTIAVALVTVVCFALVLMGLSAGLEFNSRKLRQDLQSMQRPAEQQPPQQSRAQVTRRVWVPGKSTENCLALTGGVANESYKTCRSGYYQMQSVTE